MPRCRQRCHARGVDTPYILLHSSLQAMRSRQPDAKFMTVSGDLIAHSFSCRYTTLLPGSTQSDYQAFVLKTLSFVVGELRASLSGYVCLCGAGQQRHRLRRLPARYWKRLSAPGRQDRSGGAAPSQQQQALKVFAKGGYYSLTMGAPMRNTRLIVVNDIFLSPKYSTCDGRPDSAAATEEMTWLQEQLVEARRLGQRVWVMGHIPPGVDPYSTVAKFKDVCGNEAPVMFLSSDKLADLMIEYGDVIRLGFSRTLTWMKYVSCCPRVAVHALHSNTTLRSNWSPPSRRLMATTRHLPLPASIEPPQCCRITM